MGLTGIVVRHVAFEDLGVWAEVLAARDISVRYLEAGIDPLDPVLEADLVIVLGGPIGVGDAERYPLIAAEVDVLRSRLSAGLPTVGVCLGAQLMAVSLGGQVTPGVPEIGWGVVDVADPGDALHALVEAPVLHWHGDAITAPPGVDVLASTPQTPCQAFATGSALALQFHAEVDPRRIEPWLIGHGAELAAHGIDPRILRQHSRTHAQAATDAGQSLLHAYLDQHLPAPRS